MVVGEVVVKIDIGSYLNVSKGFFLLMFRLRTELRNLLLKVFDRQGIRLFLLLGGTFTFHSEGLHFHDILTQYSSIDLLLLFDFGQIPNFSLGPGI